LVQKHREEDSAFIDEPLVFKSVAGLLRSHSLSAEQFPGSRFGLAIISSPGPPPRPSL
jgi:hypothetical protein